MKSKNNDISSRSAADGTTRAIGLLLILVLIAAGSLAACGADQPAALLDPNASYTSGASPGATAERTAEKVRVQWLIADKTTVQQGGLDVQGAATFSGGTTLDSLTVSGATALDGGLTMDTSKFTVADTTGNTLVGGTLDLRGLLSDGAGPLGINDNTSITGTVTASGAAALNGGISVDSTAFTVADTTGNTLVGGTLDLRGLLSDGAGPLGINDNTSITGTVTASGAAALNGGITVDSTAFTVADTTGNTLVGGTLDLRGLLSDGAGPLGINDNASITGTLAASGLATLTGGFTAGADGNMQANQLYFDLGHTAYIDGAAGNLDITVPASSTVDIENGGLTVAGNVTVNGAITAGSNKFTVNSTTGDVALQAGASIYPTTATTNTGTIFTCAQSLVYTEVTSKGVCVIPANANVVDAMLSVSTGFNGSGTDTVSCGYTYADPNEIFDDISVESAAVGRLATTAGLGDIGATAKTVWCKYVDQNSNASAGAMTILIYYVVD